jgi:hypothetical protein
MNPTLAVSWEGFGTDYGALVVDNRRDRVKALVYSYADAPVEGKVRVWNLAHGRYRVRMGPDGDGDWRMDREVRDGEMELMKADVIDLTLSPGRITVIEIEQVEALDPIFSRGDLAISAREVVVKGEVVSGTVHNIGSADVLDGVVAVLDAMGNVVARTSVGRIPAPLDLVPVRAPFTLRLPNKPSQGWKLTLDPDGQVSEIYEGNNEVLLDALPAVDYSGVGMK